MGKKNISRRKFVTTGVVGATGLALGMSAKSYSKILGANDRIQIGQIGTGGRAYGHRNMIKLSRDGGKNIELRSVCDIWTGNRERAADDAEKKLGTRPKTYKYAEDMLVDKDLDAVMIATGDHQHVFPMVKAINAGKDVYVEKPLANRLEQAKIARMAVRQSNCVFQSGEQWVSEPHQLKVRDIIRSGKIGKISKIDQSWNYYGPRWNEENFSWVKEIKEKDTDWDRWLAHREHIPFDPLKYFSFRLLKEFSGGITDQWYSHGVGLVHFYLDTFIPDNSVANGGIFVWHDYRETPDTLTVLSAFKEKGVLHQYSTSFGSNYGSNTIIRGTEGTLYAVGGEGSPQWWYKPGPHGHKESTVKATPILLPGETELPPTGMSDDLKPHMDDWIDCMRSRKKTNGDIDTAYAHSVAVIMANDSFWGNKMTYWDRDMEEVRG